MRKYFAWLVIFIIGLVFGPVIFNRQQKTTIELPQLNKPFTLPSLYVDKSSIMRADTHEKIWLKGVSTMTFVYRDLPTKDLLKHLPTAKSWNINLVGVFINPFTIENRWNELDEVVQWCKQNNIYVYLMPARYLRDPLHTLESQEALIPSLIEKLSIRYKSKTHVLFGLLAEPPYQAWEIWQPIASSYIGLIRAQKNNSIVIVSGSSFGRVVQPPKDNFTDAQLIFNIHDYPFIDSSYARRMNNVSESGDLWNPTYKSAPIIFGEFGGVFQSDFGGVEDLAYIKHDLDIINKHAFHYTAYSLDDYWRIGEQAIMNWEDMTLTKRGQLFKDDFTHFPPTQFNK